MLWRVELFDEPAPLPLAVLIIVRSCAEFSLPSANALALLLFDRSSVDDAEPSPLVDAVRGAVCRPSAVPVDEAEALAVRGATCNPVALSDDCPLAEAVLGATCTPVAD